MRLIEDVDATGGRRVLRHAYIWYRFATIVARDTLNLATVIPIVDKEMGP
jgi:hypothetical protein